MSDSKKIYEVASRLYENAAKVKYGEVAVALQIHDSGIVSTSYTVTDRINKRTPKQEASISTTSIVQQETLEKEPVRPDGWTGMLK
jgi:hypothetical protein